MVWDTSVCRSRSPSSRTVYRSGVDGDIGPGTPPTREISVTLSADYTLLPSVAGQGRPHRLFPRAHQVIRVWWGRSESSTKDTSVIGTPEGTVPRGEGKGRIPSTGPPE